ncbi:MAG: bifunctional riboflavin kinase/FAD synthetase [Myxococcales bacterium]|nr:bifunctional riboflavin kinase/FAD synthetase [Myxococcales bacterium]
MQVFLGYQAAASKRAPSVVAIGNFDGVHRGHQVILQRLVERARELDCRALVYTFRPHPMHVLFPERAPLLLTTYDQKVELLGSWGVDAVVMEPFSREYASFLPETFVQEVLVDALQTREVWVGPDFKFGRGGKATPDDLGRLGEAHLMDVRIIEAQFFEDIRASSTRVREACFEGDMYQAHMLLGRFFELSGLVVHGDARGRQIGFPTANVEPWQMIRPASGVYACWASWGEGWHPAAVNLGKRPTVDGESYRVEAHILDHQVDLYGKPLSLAFVERLRAEKTFTDIEALRHQIERDVADARALFSRMSPPAQSPWLGG